MFRPVFATAFAAAISLFLAVAPLATAQDLPAPSGDVILTVTGEIGVSNAREGAQFDLEMLMAMDATEIVTSTIWTEGVKTFTGVSLHVLAENLAVDGGRMLATAINDYTVEIPLGDAVPGGPILAYALDGEPMSVRDKGPLWVIYPYDSGSAYKTEVVYSRSIWQLDRIKIVE